MDKPKKPVRLEWTGGILSQPPATSEAVPVTVKGAGQPPPARASDAGGALTKSAMTGKVKLKRETKSRGGHPVVVLFAFESPALSSASALKELCTLLKQKCACGGTVEGDTIIIQKPDTEAVARILTSLGFTPVRAGG